MEAVILSIFHVARTAEFDLRMPDLTAVPREQAGRVLATHLLDRWEGDSALQILLRTAAAMLRRPFASWTGSRGRSRSQPE